jgi:hypothetical protein
VQDYGGAIFVVYRNGSRILTPPHNQRPGKLGARGERGNSMDTATILPFVVQALGGAIGGNILGAITRGGGGLLGRTLIGVIGGLAAGYAGANVEAVGNVTSMWGNLIEGENGAHLANLITGAAGGGLLGLIGGLLIRQR